jgi:phosphoribosylanthranilate isomerase
VVEIKFCGLTRPEDARLAGELGAAYLGVIFAAGPRIVSPAKAVTVLSACATGAKRVGVFANQASAEIARVVRDARLDVVQLHGDPRSSDVAELRAESGAEIWAVVRVTDTLPPYIDELSEVADALLIDSRVSGMLGGSGVPAEWDRLRPQVERARDGQTIILAGGLTPDNVKLAIAALQPNVVDVSSGVESAPGVKDHARMRAFAAAVAGAREEKA